MMMEDIISLVYSLFMNLVSIALLVVQGFALYSIAKRRGIRMPWLAWVPIGNQWLLGCISDQYRYVVKGEVKNKRKIMLALSIITYVLLFLMIIACVVMIVMMFTADGSAVVQSQDPYGFSYMLEGTDISGETAYGALGLALVVLGISFLALVLSVWLSVVTYMAYYDLFCSADPQNAVLFTVLCIFLGNMLTTILLFVCRNKDGGMPPRRDEVMQEPVYEAPVQNSLDPWQGDV